MITAVDTNILLDILIPDEDHFLNSKRLLDEYYGKGQLVICEIVYSELASQFLSDKELKTFFEDTGIRLINSDARTLYLAGERWREYTKNKKQELQCAKCGKEISLVCPKCNSNVMCRQHIISDFAIGAHALLNAECLLTRDRGFYKTYFKDLRVVR